MVTIGRLPFRLNRLGGTTQVSGRVDPGRSRRVVAAGDVKSPSLGRRRLDVGENRNRLGLGIELGHPDFVPQRIDQLLRVESG